MRLETNLFDFRNFERFYLFDDGMIAERGTVCGPPTLNPTRNQKNPAGQEIDASQSRIFALCSPVLYFTEILAKLEIFAGAAKYDAWCASGSIGSWLRI